MDSTEFETKKLEYQAAQDMLKHYDTLNWQIGSILIAGVIVLTGLVVNKDTVAMMQESRGTAFILTFAIPILSWLVLISWWTWFRRHRDLYNLRNEVLHRIEMDLNMYHFLRAVEANSRDFDKPTLERLADARKAAGHDSFEPFFKIPKLGRLSGFHLAALLAFGLPAIQFVLLFALTLNSSAQKKAGPSAHQTQTPSPSQSVTNPSATPSQMP